MTETKYINCVRCGKLIEKKVNRLYCIKCRNAIDKEIATIYRENNKEQIKRRNRERYIKKDGPREVFYS